MNRTRAARPQFCSSACQSAHKTRTASNNRSSRFWEKVKMTGSCWVWQAFCDRQGYGRFQFAYGHPMLAHRYAYELTYGRFDNSLFVCHKCDNPSCCRHDHLFLGTAADNMADAASKGRTNRIPHSRGQQVNTSKLTPEQAMEIYLSKERNCFLAPQYGISSTAIYYINKGKNWAWIHGGKMRLHEFPNKTKLLAWERSGGLCQICGMKIIGRAEYDHCLPLALGGLSDLPNCICVCSKCHRLKTSTSDIPRIAKAKRQERSHIGAKQSRNPMPGSRASKWKRTIGGKVEKRS